MKKGDKVTIRDSSYSKVITEHGLKNSYAGVNSVRGEQGVVVEINCKFPGLHKYQDKRCTFNNTVIRTNTGRIVFIEERFLKLVSPKYEIMIDIKPTNYAVVGIGQVVEIFDKLYKEIKRVS